MDRLPYEELTYVLTILEGRRFTHDFTMLLSYIPYCYLERYAMCAAERRWLPFTELEAMVKIMINV